MTKRSTRRAVPLAIACAWLVGSSPAWAAPSSAAATPAAAPAEQSASAASAAIQYTVKPGQSLADIAAAATGSHDKSVLGRAARAIFDANPSAFMRNDPSLLKLGAVLNVPALDATGAVAKPEAAPASASASASNAAPSGAAASQAAAGANASAAPAAKPASAPAAAVSSAPASAATGTAASAAQKAATPAVGAASKAAPAPASAAASAQHPLPNGAAGEHAWSGAIQPAPVAPASAPAASGAAEASAPAAGASEAPAASAPAGTSAPKPAVATSPVAAPAIGASNPKVSSLQQLLTLKNRVLMELQQHGVGAPQAVHPGAAGSAPAGASASGFAAVPASGPVVAPAPGKSRAAAAANQRFVGAGGSGFNLSRNVFPIVGAIVAAIVAALLVVLVALGVSRRRQAAPAAGATGAAGGSAAGAAASARSDEPAQTADDPIAAEFLAILARNPTSKRALMGLAAHYAERKNVQGFDEIAQRIYRLTGGRGPNWTHVASIGRQLDPHNSLYALDADETDEAVLSPGEDAGASSVPPSETSHPAPQAEERAPAEAAAPRAAEVPPEGQPVPRPASLHETPSAADASHVEGLSAAEAAPGEEVQQGHPGSYEPAARAEEGDGTLPPEAIAALDGLDIGLPPRVGTAGESPAHPPEAELDEPGPAWDEEPAAESAAGTEKSAHGATSPEASTEHAEESERGAHDAHQANTAHSAPTAAPAVSGLGAAPVGRLNLSFDLDLPGAHAREGKDGGEQSDIAPVPQFTPEQLARIARNKLELAAEYIALGDLGGARTLIHEVIESNDTATHDEAHAMLATLAPLS